MFGKISRRIAKHCEMKQWERRITKNFKDLEHRRTLTKEQKKDVQDFYKSIIGRKVPLYCQ